MPQSLSQVWIHLVFSTKERRPFLQNTGFRDEMFRMLSHHVIEAGCSAKRAGGWIDHVHIVCGLSRTVTISQLVEQVKTETSKWAKSMRPVRSLFPGKLDTVCFLLANQILNKSLRTLRIKGATTAEEATRRSFENYAANMVLNSTNDMFGIEPRPFHLTIIIELLARWAVDFRDAFSFLARRCRLGQAV